MNKATQACNEQELVAKEADLWKTYHALDLSEGSHDVRRVVPILGILHRVQVRRKEFREEVPA